MVLQRSAQRVGQDRSANVGPTLFAGRGHRRVGRSDDQGRQNFAADVLPDFDDFCLAAYLEAFRPVAHGHVFDGDQHTLANNLELGVHRTRQ